MESVCLAFTRDQLGSMLDMHSTMVDKFLCGDIEPSRHQQKQMIEILGIDERRVSNLAQRRQRRSRAKRMLNRL
jgi:predicted XRE-type DNA-binding protein